MISRIILLIFYPRSPTTRKRNDVSFFEFVAHYSGIRVHHRIETGLVVLARKRLIEKKAPLEGIEPCCEQLKASFRAGETRSYEWRVQQLLGIKRMIQDHDAALAYVLECYGTQALPSFAGLAEREGGRRVGG